MTHWTKPKTNTATMDASDYAKQTRRKTAAGARREEEAAQRLVIARCDRLAHKWPALAYVHHSANESYGGARVNGVPVSVLRNSAMGVRPGVPDLLCFEMRAGNGWAMWAGLALELKIAPNTTSTSQDDWRVYLQANGWRVETLTAPSARSLADLAWVCLAEYLGIEQKDYLSVMID